MGTTILTWLLGILTTLFGGLNIFQWITLQSYKRIKNYEADRAQIENMRLVISQLQGEVLRLEERVKRAEDNADENYKRYTSLQEEFEVYKSKHK